MKLLYIPNPNANESSVLDQRYKNDLMFAVIALKILIIIVNACRVFSTANNFVKIKNISLDFFVF